MMVAVVGAGEQWEVGGLVFSVPDTVLTGSSSRELGSERIATTKVQDI